MPSFNFFKRKGKDISKLSSKQSNIQVNNSAPIPQNLDDRLTIEDALNLLDRIENTVTLNLLNELGKTFEDTNLIFQHINNIARDLESEEIEVEEEKLAPLVKNTKNTIVRALKRESSNTLTIPKTFDEFIKFKESLDASINRFGEVTSSHSRIVNTFMKKHANSLRGDLKKISDISGKLSDGFDELSIEKKVLEECRINLSTLKTIIDEKGKSEQDLKAIDNNCIRLDKEIKLKEIEMDDLKSSSDYSKGLKYLHERELIDKERKILIDKLNRISGHLTKAANKYSYGLTKATIEKIDTIVNKPSEIAYKSDISEYLRLLKEMKQSVTSNKVILKDSNKVLQYFDILADELPNFKNEILILDSRIDKLKDREKVTILEKLNQKEEEKKKAHEYRISEDQRRDEILKNKSKIEEQIKVTLKVIEEQLQRLSTKKYKIITNLE